MSGGQISCIHLCAYRSRCAAAAAAVLLLSAYRPCSCTHPYRTRPAIRKLSSDDLYTIYNGRRDGDEYDGILYCLSDAIVS